MTAAAQPTMQRPVVLAAGGTGGHVFPARALAEALAARRHRVVLITDRRGGAFDTDLGIEVHRIRAGGIAGRGLVAKLGGAVKLLLGWLDARSLLRSLNPAVVVGFGGYASVPTVQAAHGLGLRTVLHEQNAVLGRANRLLARKATAIATCFAEVQKVASADQKKVRLTGNPVREALRAIRTAPLPPLTDNGTREILVTGGSQGASAFAKLVPAAVALLPGELRNRLRVAQQARPAECEEVEHAYDELGVTAEVKPFFDDMPARLRAAHLLICRSGASTVAENTVVGRPSLLIPYPSAIDDHQTANAHAIEAAGGAVVLPQATLTPQALSDQLAALLDDPARLTAMAEAAHAAGRPDAVDDLTDLVLDTADLTQTAGGSPGLETPSATRSAVL